MTGVARPLKVAIVGGGYGAKVALPVFQRLPGFEPVGIWSRHSERAGQLAAAAGLTVGTSDLDELLDVAGLEAVHVATPVATHADVAVAAARRGLHVLCEKPLARDLPEARRLVSAIETAGKIGVVNLGRRLQRPRERLIELVRDVVGTPRMVSVSLVRSDHAEPAGRPFTWVHDAELGGGRLQAYGVHDLDLLLQLFGEVEAVSAAVAVGIPERHAADGSRNRVTAEDCYALNLRFASGGLATVSLVATAQHGRGDVVEVFGERGSVRLDEHQRLWWGRSGEDLRAEGPLRASSTDAFTRVAEGFRAAIRHGSQPAPTLRDGLRVQAVLDAIRIAAETRRWVAPEAL